MTGNPAAGGKPRRRHESSVFLLLLLACTLITVLQFSGCAHQGRCVFAEDFEVFYGPAHAMAEGASASPYPLARAEAWVMAPEQSGIFHYSLYPPHSLLLFYPLGLLSPGMALIAWYAVQLSMLGAVCRTLYLKRMALPPAENGASRLAPLLLLLPFTILSLLAGQVGTLCAALFALTLAWRNSRPLLAALMLALLTLKPQLAFTLPVLLLAERNFKVLLAAAGFTLLLVGVSLLTFGIGAWQDYLKMLSLSPQILAMAPPQLLKGSLSPALALRMMGMEAGACLDVQLVLSLAVLAVLWRALKKADEDGKLFLLATATFLVSPYSFHYDAVLLALPCMMLMRRWRMDTITAPQRIALIVMAFIPIVAIKLQVMHIPYGFLSLLTGFQVAQANPAARG
jgi:hypothetical protein